MDGKNTIFLFLGDYNIGEIWKQYKERKIYPKPCPALNRRDEVYSLRE